MIGGIIYMKFHIDTNPSVRCEKNSLLPFTTC